MQVTQENTMPVFSIFSMGKSPWEFHSEGLHVTVAKSSLQMILTIKLVQLRDNLLMISYSVFSLTFTLY